MNNKPTISQLSKMTGQSPQTIGNWKKSKPKLFNFILVAAKLTKLMEQEMLITKSEGLFIAKVTIHGETKHFVSESYEGALHEAAKWVFVCQK